MTLLPPLGNAEKKLLLSFSRLEPTDELLSEAGRLLRGRLNWTAITAFAHLHSVGPLLHHHLRRHPDYPAVPAKARQRLLQLYHQAGYRNRLFETENHRLLEEFERAGIQVLVPKGLSLVEVVYGELTLRPLIDLIFLVRPEQLATVEAFFEDCGYHRKDHRPGDGIFRWACPQRIYRSFRGMELDVLLIWTLVTWPRLHCLDPAPVWQRGRRGWISGAPALLLSLEDLVLYLSIQADNHGYFNRVAIDRIPADELVFAEWSNNRMIRFTDLYETIRRYREEIDWYRVVDRARAAGLQAAAYSSLRLTDQMLGPCVPPDSVECLREFPRRSVRSLIGDSLAAPGTTRGSGAWIGRAWRKLRPLNQLRLARMLDWLELLFPSASGLQVKYRVRSRAVLPPVFIFHGTASIARSLASVTKSYLTRFAKRAGIP